MPVRLLDRNDTESAVHVVKWTCRPEELVGLPVHWRSPPELDSPNLVDVGGFAIGRSHRPNEFPSLDVETINVADAVEIVGYQQSVAERSEIPGRKPHAQGLIQRGAVGKMLHEHTVFSEDVNDPSRATGGVSVGDQDVAINILNAKRRRILWKGGICEGLDQVEIAIVYVHLSVGGIGGIDHVPRRLAGDRQAGIAGART